MVRFGLVVFPVEAFNAHAPESGHLPLHQLHAKCHSRIRYQKTCPIHGPVTNDEIVSGYEYSKGHYVEIDAEELDELRTDEERSLTIDAFVTPAKLDPIYLDGRMYYLSPEGAAAREPYAVFLEALKRQERWGVGQVIFSGKQQVALLRPYRDALHMALLNYAAEIRDPESVVSPPEHVSEIEKKVKLAEQLIENWGEPHFDLSKYHDTYIEKEKALIKAKAEGREIVVSEPEERPQVINLMDALKKSMASLPERAESAAGSAHRQAHKEHARNGHPKNGDAHHAARRASSGHRRTHSKTARSRARKAS